MTLRTSPWPVAGAPVDYVIAGARLVLPADVVEGAVVVRGGRIAEILPGRTRGDLDAGGLLVMPGIVDVHSDALEKERAPRPTAVLPWDFALTGFEGRLRSAGITTMFHGAGFQHKMARGVRRDPARALELVRQVRDHVPHGVDHRVLHRLDLLSPGGADALREWLDERPDDGVPPLVSHEDHTPGQGQYVDPQHLVDYIVGADGLSEAEAWQRIDDMRAEGVEMADVRRENLAWLGDLARTGRIRLMGHDPDTAEVVDDLVRRGGTVAEFPTTLEAAKRARERGLLIVAGAPNVLRGGSHTGNVSAAELAHLGLLDALASDYLPTGMLGAVTVLAPQIGLPRAVALVTAGPAKAGGLDDRGVLAEGARADLVVVDDTAPWLRVAQTLSVAG